MSRLLTTGVLQQARNLSAKKQYALSFDGVDDYVNLPLINTWNNYPTTEMTIEGKAEIKSDTSNGCIFQSGITAGMLLAVTAAGNVLRFYINTTGTWYFMEVQLSQYLNEWFNYSMTYNGAEFVVYINGIEVLKTSMSGNISYFDVRSTRIGSYYHPTVTAASGYMNGNISDVRVWNIRLTQQQIQDNLNKKLIGNEPGLVAYYDFSEGEGNILYDKTPNANHGTIYGATWVEI